MDKAQSWGISMYETQIPETQIPRIVYKKEFSNEYMAECADGISFRIIIGSEIHVYVSKGEGWATLKVVNEDADFTQIINMLLDLGKKLLESVNGEKCDIFIRESKEEREEFKEEFSEDES